MVMKATGDIEEIRRWAASPEGVAAIKKTLQWARDKLRSLERSQRVGPARLDKRVTR